MIDLHTIPPATRNALKALVHDLITGNFDAIEADGRCGQTTGPDLARVLRQYRKTFVDLPDEAFVQARGSDNLDDSLYIDLPLWTIEEGRSDLQLQVVVKQATSNPQVTITDLRVL